MFVQGNKREATIIDRSFKKLMNLIRKSERFRFMVGSIDSIFTKYMGTTVGFSVLAIPYLWAGVYSAENSSYNDRLEDYYTSGRMLRNLTSAIGSLVSSVSFNSAFFVILIRDFDSGDYHCDLFHTTSLLYCTTRAGR